MSTILELVSDLETLSNRGMVPARDQNFADSLCNTYRKFGKVSGPQKHWIEVLIQRALGITENKPSKGESIGTSFEKVFAMFANTAGKLKYPKFKINEGKLGVVVFRVAGNKSKYAGDITITSDGDFHDRFYYGSINPEGVFNVSYKVTEATKYALVSLLLILAENPVEVVSTFGKASGNCCFCVKTLTTKESLSAGYGPVCAGNYGLPWG